MQLHESQGSMSREERRQKTGEKQGGENNVKTGTRQTRGKEDKWRMQP